MFSIIRCRFYYSLYPRIRRQINAENFTSNALFHTSKHTDAKYLTRALAVFPQSADPYIKLARYDRPAGTWLLYLPCTWSIALAASPGQFPQLDMLALFGLGAVLMRGAGCIINDLWDRNIDCHVERTKDRPLACGSLSPFNAFVFLGVKLLASLIVLLQLNWYSVWLGCASMIPVVTYPLFKRITHWPQIVLGITFNWGALLGYSAIVGHIDPFIALPLYIAGINWTLIYDTIYAHQDIEDDLLIGVKSTAIRFGDKTKPILSLFHGGMLLNLLMVGAAIDAGPVYYTGTVLTMAHIAHLIWKTELKKPESCLDAFKAGRTTGFIYFLTVVSERLLNV